MNIYFIYTTRGRLRNKKNRSSKLNNPQKTELKTKLEEEYIVCVKGRAALGGDGDVMT